MFAVRQVRAWCKSCVDFCTENGKPTLDEIHDARELSRSIVLILEYWQDYLPRTWPHNPEVIETARLIDQFLQGLKADHGGKAPDQVLEFWAREREKWFCDKDIFSKSAEKEAMVRLWQMWHNMDGLDKTFWPIYSHPYNITENRIPEAKQCMLALLEKRRNNGQLY